MKYICDHANCSPECKDCRGSEPHMHMGAPAEFYCDVACMVLVRCIPVKPARKPRRAGK